MVEVLIYASAKACSAYRSSWTPTHIATGTSMFAFSSDSTLRHQHQFPHLCPPTLRELTRITPTAFTTLVIVVNCTFRPLHTAQSGGWSCIVEPALSPSSLCMPASSQSGPTAALPSGWFWHPSGVDPRRQLVECFWDCDGQGEHRDKMIAAAKSKSTERA